MHWSVFFSANKLLSCEPFVKHPSVCPNRSILILCCVRFRQMEKGSQVPDERFPHQTGSWNGLNGTVLSFYRAFLRCVVQYFLGPGVNSLNLLRDNDSSDSTTNGTDTVLETHDEAWGRKEKVEESKRLWLRSPPHPHTHTTERIFSARVLIHQ